MNDYNYLASWSDVVLVSLQDLWVRIASFIPQLLSALIVLILGLMVASALGKLASRFVKMMKIDSLTEKVGVSKLFEGSGIAFTFSGLIGWAIKWFFIITILIAVADILQWTQITAFLNEVALYIPNVIVAIIILAIALIAARFVHDVVKKGVEASKNFSSEQSGTLANIAKWALIIFGLLASLVQMGIATRLIEILFTGVVIALALAFGLGGKEKAAQWLDTLDSSSKK